MWVNFSWIHDGSNRGLNRSQIFKFEKLPDTDPDIKILEQERSGSLKNSIRPPLLHTRFF